MQDYKLAHEFSSDLPITNEMVEALADKMFEELKRDLELYLKGSHHFPLVVKAELTLSHPIEPSGFAQLQKGIA